jgi:hypothetical protein
MILIGCGDRESWSTSCWPHKSVRSRARSVPDRTMSVVNHGRSRARYGAADLHQARSEGLPRRSPKPQVSLAGCPFRAENWGWLLSADADYCLTVVVVSKPGAGSRYAAARVAEPPFRA